MPKLNALSGDHLPHHRYVAQAVTVLEELGRGPARWMLWGTDQDDVSLLGAQLVWSPDRRRDPLFPLQLVVEWDRAGGWSYDWTSSFITAEDGPRTLLTVPADAEAAAVVRLLEHAVTAEDDPAREAATERLAEAAPSPGWAAFGRVARARRQRRPGRRLRHLCWAAAASADSWPGGGWAISPSTSSADVQGRRRHI
ncbi:hypothetical protein [Kitasatospora sp. NPDC015120]|uniref:hypothetical protein n=1 Tax=Kitasatospora sp. NPDC015120 TaxID=3364023 RepID=UPI0036F45D29